MHGSSRSQNGIATTFSSQPGPAKRATRRRKTDPLESIRNALFGSRTESDSRPSSRQSVVTSRAPSSAELQHPPSAADQKDHREIDESSRHVRKSSISPPFNFAHVAHTAPHAPAATTSQKGDMSLFPETTNLPSLPPTESHAQLSTTTAEERPIQKQPSFEQMPAHMARSFVRQTEVIEQVFGNHINQSIPRPPSEKVDGYRRPPHIVRHTRQASLVGSTTTPALDKPLPSRPAARFGDGNDALRDDGSQRDLPKFPVITQLDAVPEESSDTPTSSAWEPSEPQQQFLPPLSTIDTSIGKVSPQLGHHAGESTTSVSTCSWSPVSTRRRRARSRTVSSTASSSSKTRDQSWVSGESWEDEVDFMYEQQAESTCDFDWQGLDPVPEPLYSSRQANERRKSPSNESTSPQRTIPRKTNVHQRGSSVGHLGFLAARRSPVGVPKKPDGSDEGTTPYLTVIHPSPTLNVTGAEADEEIDQSSTRTCDPVPNFGNLEVGDLSDPESVRTGGSNHRKCSSCGSHNMVTRSSSTATKDGTRWSMASSPSNSIRRNGSQTRAKPTMKTTDITPSTVQQSCKSKNIAVPNNTPTSPTQIGLSDRTLPDQFFMRRPQTTGERSVLQAAGRAVQRGRPNTPNRFSRIAYDAHLPVATTAPEGWI